MEIRNRCTIGRGSECEVTLTGDGGVSRRHAALTVTAYGIAVEDLGSKNGVWVDGERVERHQFFTGSHELRVGRTTFRLVALDEDTKPRSRPHTGRPTEPAPRPTTPPESNERGRASGLAWSGAEIYDAAVDDGDAPDGGDDGMDQTG